MDTYKIEFIFLYEYKFNYLVAKVIDNINIVFEGITTNEHTVRFPDAES